MVLVNRKAQQGLIESVPPVVVEADNEADEYANSAPQLDTQVQDILDLAGLLKRSLQGMKKPATSALSAGKAKVNAKTTAAGPRSAPENAVGNSIDPGKNTSKTLALAKPSRLSKSSKSLETPDQKAHSHAA